MLVSRPPQIRRMVLGGVALIAVAALVIVVIRPWGSSGPRLESRTDGSTSGAVDAPGPGQYYYFAAGQVCIGGKGTATIRSVEPVDAHGGLTVTDFAVFDRDPDMMGADHGRLRDLSGKRGTSKASEPCEKEVSAPELYIEVLKPRSEDAWADAFDINYDLDGHSRTEQARFGFGVCEKDLDDCDHNAWKSEN